MNMTHGNETQGAETYQEGTHDLIIVTPNTCTHLNYSDFLPLYLFYLEARSSIRMITFFLDLLWGTTKPNLNVTNPACTPTWSRPTDEIHKRITRISVKDDELKRPQINANEDSDDTRLAAWSSNKTRLMISDPDAMITMTNALIMDASWWHERTKQIIPWRWCMLHDHWWARTIERLRSSNTIMTQHGWREWPWEQKAA